MKKNVNFSGRCFSRSLSLTHSRAGQILGWLFGVFCVFLNEGKWNFSRCCCRLIQVSRNIRWWMCNFFSSYLRLPLSRAPRWTCWHWDCSLTQWYFRDFSPAFFPYSWANCFNNQVCFLSPVLTKTSRDQLYHFDSPECVKFSSFFFFSALIFIKDFFSSCNYKKNLRIREIGNNINLIRWKMAFTKPTNDKIQLLWWSADS